jgi:hypothetical protein
MVNTPFFMSPAQQVLVKGVQISSSNLQEILSFVENQFHLLEGKIADVTAMVHDQNEFQKVVSSREMVSSNCQVLDAIRRYRWKFI